jgi:hypothetical protein
MSLIDTENTSRTDSTFVHGREAYLPTFAEFQPKNETTQR